MGGIACANNRACVNAVVCAVYEDFIMMSALLTLLGTAANAIVAFLVMLCGAAVNRHNHSNAISRRVFAFASIPVDIR